LKAHPTQPKALTFTSVLILILTLLLSACGENTATTATTTTIATSTTGVTTSTQGTASSTPTIAATTTIAPSTTDLPIPTTVPHPSPTPVANLVCINTASDKNPFGNLQVGTYGCVEGVVLGVSFNPGANDQFVYSKNVAVAISLYNSFEIGISANIMVDKKNLFDQNTLQQLKGKKVRLKGEVSQLSTGRATIIIKGFVLEQPNQLQDLSNEP